MSEFSDAVAPFATEWDSLVDRSANPCPWLRPGWMEAWWHAFGRGRFRLVTMCRGNRLAALTPFAEVRGSLIAPANYHTPAFEFVGEDESAVGALAAEVLHHRPRRLQARFLPSEDATVRALRVAARSCHYRVRVRTLERSPYVDTTPGWEAYVATLDGKLRRELRRRKRKLAGQGQLDLVVESGQERLDDLLEEGFRVEAAAWKGSHGTAIASSAPTRRFYRDVASWAASRGTLRLAYLRLDGRPVAFDFAIEDDGRHYLLKTGYEPALRALSPGMLLRFEMLERAFRLGLRSYEFLGTDEPWKLDWTPAVRERVEFQAFDRTAAGLADWAADTYARPLAVRALALVGR